MTINRGDIIDVELPEPNDHDGHIQLGKRPALVVQTNEDLAENFNTVMIIPLTKHLSALKYRHTLLAEPSFVNGLNVQSVILVPQLRAVDRKLISGVIGTLEPRLLQEVDKEIRNLLNL